MTPTLAAPGIVLRPLALTDAEALHVAMSDEEVQRYRRAAAHADVAQTRAYIEDTLAKGIGWAITRDGGEALGRLALRLNGDSGEFGIVIRRAAHGQGLGRKALMLASDYAFTTLGLARLTADIDTRNTASLAVFAHAGFVRTGLRRKARTTHIGPCDSAILTKERPG
ncbi:MAG: GNAT family N-acetyltransferase [Hyphomonadaceae bacterium]